MKPALIAPRLKADAIMGCLTLNAEDAGIEWY